MLAADLLPGDCAPHHVPAASSNLLAGLRYDADARAEEGERLEVVHDEQPDILRYPQTERLNRRDYSFGDDVAGGEDGFGRASATQDAHADRANVLRIEAQLVRLTEVGCPGLARRLQEALVALVPEPMPVIVSTKA